MCFTACPGSACGLEGRGELIYSLTDQIFSPSHKQIRVIVKNIAHCLCSCQNFLLLLSQMKQYWQSFDFIDGSVYLKGVLLLQKLPS